MALALCSSHALQRVARRVLLARAASSSVQDASVASASAFARYVRPPRRSPRAPNASDDTRASGAASGRRPRAEAPVTMRSLNTRRNKPPRASATHAADSGAPAPVAPETDAATVTSLGADPYAWDVAERDVREAPLWMAYEAEREETAVRAAAHTHTRTRADNRTEIRAPLRDALGRVYATGRRKTAAARVWVSAGDGGFIINGVPLAAYFARMSDRVVAAEALLATRTCGALDVRATVKGGGIAGQAGALRHGLANALCRFDPYLKPRLRDLRLIHRDPRMVERKKPGQMKARRKFQWIKR